MQWLPSRRSAGAIYEPTHQKNTGNAACQGGLCLGDKLSSSFSLHLDGLPGMSALWHCSRGCRLIRSPHGTIPIASLLYTGDAKSDDKDTTAIGSDREQRNY